MRRRTVITRLAMVLALALVAAATTPTYARGGKKTGNIAGVVVNQYGQTLSGATVQLFDGVAIDQIDEDYTNAAGEFAFTRLSPGDYSMTAYVWGAQGIGFGNATATVTAGSTTSVTIVIEVQGPFPP